MPVKEGVRFGEQIAWIYLLPPSRPKVVFRLYQYLLEGGGGRFWCGETDDWVGVKVVKFCVVGV